MGDEKLVEHAPAPSCLRGYHKHGAYPRPKTRSTAPFRPLGAPDRPTPLATCKARWRFAFQAYRLRRPVHRERRRGSVAPVDQLADAVHVEGLLHDEIGHAPEECLDARRQQAIDDEHDAVRFFGQR